MGILPLFMSHTIEGPEYTQVKSMRIKVILYIYHDTLFNEESYIILD